MSLQIFRDRSLCETRLVLVRDGCIERLVLIRPDDPSHLELGSKVVARVTSLSRALGAAFLELPGGEEGFLQMSGAHAEAGLKLTEGLSVLVSIRSEARPGKSATLKLEGPADGKVRVLEPGLDAEAALLAMAPDARPVEGDDAREVADQAQALCLSTVIALAGGGDIAIEPTRALVAVDVDVGNHQGVSAKKVTRAVNLAALETAARMLRLKGLGGLVIFDLAGRGHDAAAVLNTARIAFGPDNPGVAINALSRFGTLELTVPRRRRAVLDQLIDTAGQLTDGTVLAQAGRRIEAEARSDRGGRFVIRLSPEMTASTARLMAAANDRFGHRFRLTRDPALARQQFDIRPETP